MKHVVIATLCLSLLPAVALAAPATTSDKAAAKESTASATSLRHPARAAHAKHMGAMTKHEVMLPRLHEHRTVARRAHVPARMRRHVAKPVPSEKQAEREGFKKVSSLVNFPAFYPGLGVVYVKPDTLPVGPFRCFDRKGKLVASVYMLSLKDLDDQKRWDYVKGLPAPADHATFYYHPGHPGVPVPHYHFVIWHVPKAQEALVAR